MPIYNKLVRDRVPEIILASGKIPITRTLGDADFVQALKVKILEEAQELLLADDEESSIAELADILEVISAYVRAARLTRAVIEHERERKIEARGAFLERVFLIEVQGT
jgi:predicted house-cleaning noncanonical NTP pyrophosphatase (MazG superfamily)